MKKIVVILGPTATGKTDLVLILAKKLKGEIIACDSRQIYRGLDIGTGKMPGKISNLTKYNGYWNINGVNVWMYDVANLKKQYTVYDYVKDANKVIQDITIRGKLPIIVGGTGLYLKAITYGLSNLDIPVNQKLRKNLLKLSLNDLQKKLQGKSKSKWDNMNQSDRNNPRRLIRRIELTLMSPHTPYPLSHPSYQHILKIGLNAPREILYEKINRTAEKWIEQGIIDEVKYLIKKGISKKRFKDLGLEYGVIIDYIDGKLTKKELIEKMKIKVRQYAKRQITWFKKEKDINWFDITTSDYQKRIEKLIAQWYD